MQINQQLYDATLSFVVVSITIRLMTEYKIL